MLVEKLNSFRISSGTSYDTDYTGCSDTVRYIECPNCKTEISVSYS